MITELLSIDFDAPHSPGEFILGPENLGLSTIVNSFPQRLAEQSPLVIYGEHFSGKTHLARGLAARWLVVHPDAKVCVTTASDYAREFAQACRADAVDAFGARYRNCDLFMLDALEQMADKVASQEHLCRTVDALRSRQAACVVTMRHAPMRLRGLAPALVSRLAQGLCVPVKLPSLSTRSELAMQLAKRRGMTVDEAAAQLLAEQLPAGVAPIANAVAQLHRQYNGELAIDDVKQWLEDRGQPAEIPLASIACAAAKLCGVRVGQLKSSSRRTNDVRARGLAMLAARRLTGLSLSAIGHHFGRRDHTTVMHACQKTEERIAGDEVMASLWEEMLSNCREQRCSPASPSAAENLSLTCQPCS